MVRKPTMSIADIRVGHRHRKDMGDIDTLARNIGELGLLHPVVVRPDGTLIAGERRLRAVQLLGWKDIPVTIIDLDQVARGEFAENVWRKDFTLSEAVAIKRAVEPLMKVEAKQRKVQGGKLKGKASANLAGAKGDARDLVAARTGKARTTLAKAEELVAALEAEPDNPQIKRLVDAMDQTGRVNGPYRRLINMKQAEAIRAEPPPLPNKGPYRAAMIDIPWAYEPDDDEAAYRGVLPYPTMSIEEACAFARDKIAPIMHDDSALWMWVTNYIFVWGRYIPVLKACGFKPITAVTWPKEKVGRGHYVNGQTEHMVLAVRGKPVVTLTDQTTLLKGPFHLVQKGAHSAKPVEAYTFIKSLCPAPRYADLFSRYQHNDRWDCHGDQAPKAEAAE